MLDRIQAEMAWQLGIAYNTPAACYHGGAFFDAVGDEFSSLEKLDTIINADVLDAWFSAVATRRHAHFVSTCRNSCAPRPRRVAKGWSEPSRERGDCPATASCPVRVRRTSSFSPYATG